MSDGTIHFSNASRRGIALRVVGPLLIAFAFVAMLAWTWGGWPDPLIDFGRELYFPWQIATGKVLYRDLAQFNGPLSQYFNALLFRAFGIGLRTLVFANIAIAAAVVVMIYKLWRLAGDRLSATVASLTFVLLFMCLQLVGVGNYNWITPYAHELTHGVALSLAAILASAGFLIHRRATRAAIAGALLGLVFLTKPEVFLAAGAAVGAMMLGAAWFYRLHRSQIIHALLAFTGAFIAPIALSFLWLKISLPARDALRGTLGGWWYVFDSRLSQLYFYRQNLGTNNVRGNSLQALKQVALYLLFFAPAVLLDRFLVANQIVRTIAAIVYGVILAAVLIALHDRFYEGFYGLSPAVALLLLALVASVVRGGASPRMIVRISLTLFAMGMLLKMILAARLYHYGFVLAMPAVLVLTAYLTSWLPKIIRRGGCTTRAAALVAIAVTIGVHLVAFNAMFRHKTLVIAANTDDEFHADQNGTMIAGLVRLVASSPPKSSIAVIPQGVMINYLAGRENPTPFTTILPGEVEMFGDATIRDAYAAHPPDGIILIIADYRDMGFDSFAGWSPLLTEWISANYQLASTISGKGANVQFLLPKKDFATTRSAN